MIRIVDFQITKVINYVQRMNGKNLIQRLILTGDETLRDVVLTITSSNPDLLHPMEIKIDLFPKEVPFQIKEAEEVLLNSHYLAGLSDKLATELVLEIKQDEKTLFSHAVSLDVMPPNYKCITRDNPEYYASFVIPNHPLIADVKKIAQDILEKNTGDPSFVGYLTHDPMRVLQTISAIYSAIRSLDLAYAISPASNTENDGQYVRLLHDILREKEFNCLDSTCFFCGMCEDAGYNCGMILVPGHAFAFCSLKPVTFPYPVIRSKDELLKRLYTDLGSGKGSNGDLIVVECTAMSRGKNCSFEDAMESAARTLRTDPFEYAIDVIAARNAGVRPIDIHHDSDEESYTIQVPKFDDTLKVPDILDHAETDEAAPAQYSKIDVWKKRLLSRGSRNPLLNFGFSKNYSIPICCQSMTDLMDAVSDENREFEILAQPASPGVTLPSNFEELSCAPFNDKVNLDENRLRSPLPEKMIYKSCEELAKISQTSLNERGVNALYMAAGFMRWCEDGNVQECRYAPLLLFPVNIVKTGVRFKLRMREGEVLLNSPLVEKLNSDFNTDVPRWEELPKDDKGKLNIRKILASMRLAVSELPGFEVFSAVSVGNFSFADLPMWQDLHLHQQELNEIPLTASLIAGKLLLPESKEEALCDPDEMLHPIPLDESQASVVASVKSGVSSVVHGPPGTGKSQCNTVVLASAMGDGKSVAFVSEKQAAIAVPERRLESLGLGLFCLNLHSPSSPKNEVLRKWEKVLELANELPKEQTSHEDILQRTVALRKEINRYGEALHKPRECGMSLYELIGRYEEMNGQQEEYYPDPDKLPAPETLTAESLAQQKDILHHMARLVKVLGEPANHALRDLNNLENTQKFKHKLSQVSAAYMTSLEKLKAALEDFCGEMGLDIPTTYNDIKSVAELAQAVMVYQKLPLCWEEAASLEEDVLLPLENIATLYMKAQELKDGLLVYFTEDIFTQDVEELVNAYDRYYRFSKVPLMANWSFESLSNRLRRFLNDDNADTALTAPAIRALVVNLRDYHEKAEEADALLKELHPLVMESFGGVPADWRDVLVLVDEAKVANSKLSAFFAAHDNGPHKAAVCNGGTADDLQKRWANLKSARSSLYQLLNRQYTISGHDWIKSELEFSSMITDHVEQISDWGTFRSLCDTLCEEHSLDEIVVKYMEGVDPEEVNRAYFKATYRSLIGSIMDTDPAFENFSGELIDYRVKTLCSLEKELSELAAKDIYNKVLLRVRELVDAGKHTDSELSCFCKVIRGKERNMTIRNIFAKYFDIIKILTPCIMLSPTSMAQYIPFRRDTFDLLVVDEASQLTTAKAVGSLARASQAVIFGDCNQMPPTTFFDTMDYVDDPMVDDLESILDDYLALNLPSNFLKTHYRSDFESLIHFSNSRFYDSKLITFPSAKDRASHVHFRYIKDGEYDGGGTRQNPKEAAAVMEYLKEHCRDEERKHMTVGIISFNIPQQKCLESLLTKASENDEILRQWLGQCREPLFIKNLENAQGDERDVILLSINFGHDSKTQKLSMNFGAISKDSGYRRLNVAISRARKDMIVFSSIRPEEIDLGRANARGAKELKAFLEYADGSPLPVTTHNYIPTEQPSGIVAEICRVLKDMGYETVTNVGTSKMKIDIAVVDPKKGDSYLMGILLDGMCYKNTQRAYDREVAQPQMLRNLGWNLHRIWSIEWFDHKNREIRKLLSALEDLSA